MVIGVAFVFSATNLYESQWNAALYQQSWFRQIFWCVMGVTAASLICLVDYIVLARWSMVLYWAIIISLVAVFFFTPSERRAPLDQPRRLHSPALGICQNRGYLGSGQLP